MTRRVSLVVLAAGQSLRFGGDKLKHEIDGVPMLLRALRLYAALSDRFCRRTVVLCPERACFQAEAEALGYRVVYNDRPADGQSRSVRLGALDAMQANPDGILFSVADQPYLTAKTVTAILDRFDGAPDRIVQPAANGRRGNPVLFPAACIEALCSLSGDVGGSAVIHSHPELLLTVEAAAKELMDIDRRTEGSQ